MRAIDLLAKKRGSVKDRIIKIQEDHFKNPLNENSIPVIELDCVDRILLLEETEFADKDYNLRKAFAYGEMTKIPFGVGFLTAKKENNKEVRYT